MFPLDAAKELELYGQPVASELSRALAAGGVDVVVVGRKMATPERVTLIIDGKIVAKGDAITIAIRIRRKIDGTVLVDHDKLSETAPNLETLDKAAAALSARLLPAVSAKLAAPGEVSNTVVVPPPAQPELPVKKQMLVAVTGGDATLRTALGVASDGWISAHDREPTHAEVTPKSVAQFGTELGVAFVVEGYTVTRGTVPYARARVRVKVAGPTEVIFDRVVVTDTIVGDKNLALDKLAARVADEVLVILRPHMRRVVKGWR